MYLLRYTLTKMRDQDLWEALDLALEARGEGKGSAILSEEEVKKMFPEMQDLTPFMKEIHYERNRSV